MNARHRLHWQCRDTPVSSWHTISCRRNLASYPAAISHMRCCNTSYGVSPSCHAPEPSNFCMRILARDRRLYRQICCKISGRKHVLLDGMEIFCTNLTEWLLQETEVSVRGECCGHGCQTTIVHGSGDAGHTDLLLTSMSYKLIQSLIQRPTCLQRLCNELVGQGWQEQGTQDKVKERPVSQAWCVSDFCITVRAVDPH